MKRGGPLQRKVPLRANGGKARAEKLSAERRREIASAGGRALQAQRVAERPAIALTDEQRAAVDAGEARLCGKCGAPHQRRGRQGLVSLCSACHCESTKQWRTTHQPSAEQRLKANARSYAKTYLKRGHLHKEPCEVCGDENVEMHHDDYSKPLQVRWLCRRCHLDHHHGADGGAVADAAAALTTFHVKPRAVMALARADATPAPKEGRYISEAWRKAVAELPCVFCGKASQAAHRNEGKGMGIKTDDSLTAALCPTCHAEIDQGSKLARHERRARIDSAIVLTVRELVRRERLFLAPPRSP